MWFGLNRFDAIASLTTLLNIPHVHTERAVSLNRIARLHMVMFPMKGKNLWNDVSIRNTSGQYLLTNQTVVHRGSAFVVLSFWHSLIKPHAYSVFKWNHYQESTKAYVCALSSHRFQVNCKLISTVVNLFQFSLWQCENSIILFSHRMWFGLNQAQQRFASHSDIPHVHRDRASSKFESNCRIPDCIWLCWWWRESNPWNDLRIWENTFSQTEQKRICRAVVNVFTQP